MAQIAFTAEPELFGDDHGAEQANFPLPDKTGSLWQLEPLQQQWDEDMWADGILEHKAIAPV